MKAVVYENEIYGNILGIKVTSCELNKITQQDPNHLSDTALKEVIEKKLGYKIDITLPFNYEGNSIIMPLALMEDDTSYEECYNTKAIGKGKYIDPDTNFPICKNCAIEGTNSRNIETHLLKYPEDGKMCWCCLQTNFEWNKRHHIPIEV